MLATALTLALSAVPVPRSTAAVLPPGAADEQTRALGLVLQTRTAEVLRASGAFNELHAKQMLSMSGNEAFDPWGFGRDAAADADVAAYLGADVFVASRLDKKQAGWALSGFVGTRGKAPTELKTIALPASPVAAVEQATQELTRRVAAAAERKGLTFADVGAGTKSDEALLAYARCYAVLAKQPMGIENPVVLDAEALTGAIADCRKALEVDDKFAAARHALALALAIDGSDAEASKLLSMDKDTDDALWWVARFWLVTRYQSGEAGVALLEDAIAKRPGFLLAQVYLCEHLGVMLKWADALPACQRAAEKTPKGVFPLLRVGKVQARLFQLDESIKTTKAALALMPPRLQSREAQLQLASRYVDASMLFEAIEVLEPMVKSEHARGEEILRLGYAYELRGDPAKAMPLYQQAIATATSPAEWRTRGRAWYDVAVLEARAGNNGKAQTALAEAYKTGYRRPDLDPELKGVARALERGAVSKGEKGKPPLAPSPPREVSLFPTNTAGELDVEAPRKEPPPEFTGIRF